MPSRHAFSLNWRGALALLALIIYSALIGCGNERPLSPYFEDPWQKAEFDERLLTSPGHEDAINVILSACEDTALQEPSVELALDRFANSRMLGTRGYLQRMEEFFRLFIESGEANPNLLHGLPEISEGGGRAATIEQTYWVDILLWLNQHAQEDDTPVGNSARCMEAIIEAWVSQALTAVRAADHIEYLVTHRAWEDRELTPEERDQLDSEEGRLSLISDQYGTIVALMAQMTLPRL